MESITVHVQQGNSAAIRCLFCGGLKQASVEKFKNVKHIITTRCSCGKRFEVKLNFRRYYRKEVSLTGEFMILTSNFHEWAVMHVRDLSMCGLRMKMSYTPQVQKGDILRVKFSLDGKKPATIAKKVGVMFVDGDTLGCEFMDLALEEKDLGFYLLN